MPVSALRRHRGPWFFCGLVASLGCGDRPSFACTEDTACGADGRCEITGHCSFPDASCELGRRYGEHAPPSLSGACVAPGPIAGTDATTGEDPTRASTTEGDGTASITGAPTGTTLATTTDDASTGDASTEPGESSAAGDSSGSSTKVTVGPMFIEEDLDDGAMWPSVGGDVGMWLPSGESRPGFGFLGEYPDGHAYYGYFRFHLPEAIPADAIISSANLEIRGWTVYQWNYDADALRIWLQDSADAPQVAGLDDYPAANGSVELRGESARWPAQGGLEWDTSMALNATPDLATLVADLVAARGGFEMDDHVQLWIAADDLGLGGREVGWLDAGEGADLGASLTIEIEIP